MYVYFRGRCATFSGGDIKGQNECDSAETSLADDCQIEMLEN